MSSGLDLSLAAIRSILQGETVVHASGFSVLNLCSGSVRGSGLQVQVAPPRVVALSHSGTSTEIAVAV